MTVEVLWLTRAQGGIQHAVRAVHVLGARVSLCGQISNQWRESNCNRCKNCLKKLAQEIAGPIPQSTELLDPIAAAEQRGYQRAGADIAERIRAELVCCNIYDQDAGTSRAGRTHGICFWGEAGARLAEDVAVTGVAGSDGGAFADAVEAVEARGRAKAIADLRDTAAYRMWQAKNHLYYSSRAELIAYLEAKDPES